MSLCWAARKPQGREYRQGQHPTTARQITKPPTKPCVLFSLSFVLFLLFVFSSLPSLSQPLTPTPTFPLPPPWPSLSLGSPSSVSYRHILHFQSHIDIPFSQPPFSPSTLTASALPSFLPHPHLFHVFSSFTHLSSFALISKKTKNKKRHHCEKEYFSPRHSSSLFFYASTPRQSLNPFFLHIQASQSPFFCSFCVILSDRHPSDI